MQRTAKLIAGGALTVALPTTAAAARTAPTEPDTPPQPGRTRRLTAPST